MEMLQNVSNCHKSERSRNKNNLSSFHCCIGHCLRASWAGLKLFGREIEFFLFFTFAECLELIKGRKQFHTAPHLKFEKFHHNRRIALNLQRCILGSLVYLCSFSWFPDPTLSRRKSLLNTKLAFPGMRFHLKCTHESLRAAFRGQNCPQLGRG